MEARGKERRAEMIATVTIDSIAAGGDGVGRHDGLVVFVPRTAPGDLVRVDVEPRGRFARTLPLDIVVASPERVDPSCVHYTRDACGGCQVQHLSYGAQLAAKRGIVRDAVERIGRRTMDPPFIRESREQWRYRSKLTLALRRRGGKWIGGLHRFDDPDRVFALSDCPITRRDIVHVWREVLAAGDHFPEARDLRGSVRDTSDGPTFTLLGGRRWATHAEFFEATPGLSALWWQPEDSEVRFLHARRGNSASEAAEAGAAFTQVNPPVAAELHRHVVGLAAARSPTHVVDAYAGTGVTSAALIERSTRVTAIELDPHAAKAASRRLVGATVKQGTVEDHLETSLPADVVILNPPRSGVHEAVTAVLERSSVPSVIYVSCNPATLARDLTRLPSYRIESAVLFDMFPQTAHVETVCELMRSA
jgi:23S rRNA (uracil1939-C5)-methyltransferase